MILLLFTKHGKVPLGALFVPPINDTEEDEEVQAAAATHKKKKKETVVDAEDATLQMLSQL